MNALAALRHRIDSSWPTASLRTYLLAAILLATLPIASLMCYWIFTDIQGQQQRMQIELQRSANSLAQIVEGELVSSIDALTILANMESLQRQDIAGFEQALRGNRAPLRPGWLSAYLLDRDGNLLFNTAAAAPGRPRKNAAPFAAKPPSFPAPFSTPFPANPANPVESPPPPSTRQPPPRRPARISNLIDGRSPEQRAIAIDVPVLIDGKPRYRLGAWIAASAWQELLEKAGPPDGAGAVAAIHDREHRLIARSEAPEKFVGSTLPAALVDAMAGAPSGIHRPPRGQSGDSGATVDAWETVALAGWGVTVGVPAAALDARQGRAVGAALATVAACLIVGVLLALLMARRLTRPLHELTEDPQAQAGEPIAVREVAKLRDALLAARALEENAQARLKAKRDLLQRKADEFETLFESSPIGLAFAQDAACREVLRNAAMISLFGPPEGAAGTLQVLCHGQRLEAHEQPLQRAAAEGESVQGMELELRSEGQAPKFVLVNAVPLSDGDGRPRGALSAVVDITERKRAEARLASAEKNLRESQRLIDLAQEAGHVGFFHYLFETNALAWTPGMSRLFGVEAAQETSWEQFLARIGGEHRERVRNSLRQAYAARQEKETLEFPIVLPGGARRWLSSRIVVNYGDDGRPLEMIGVTLDINDQKEAERGRAALIQHEHAARIEAEAANRAKDEFLAMLGHELRNPLSAIAAAIEVLNHVDAGAETALSARGIIARQTRHLARLMDDMLDVARVISGKILLTPQNINLAPLVERLVATMKLTGVADRHTVNVEVNDVWIDADATRIEQIVNNLLTNALKYTPAGGHIDVRVDSDGDEALLEVRDTGVGISPTLLPKIFDLFVQAERTLDRRAGGLGIGLTLVRRLVELHGGTVSAASSAAGSVFTVRLPAIEAPAGAPVRNLVSPSRRRRIGLIEDNEDALNSLHQLLELDGHSVWCATDGVSGLASLLEQRPDVAVVDIGLPGLTGFEVAKRSRAAGYAGRMIALSGYSQDVDGGQALAAGFDVYLVKPVDPDELRRVLTTD